MALIILFYFIFLKIFTGYAWLAMQGPCMTNYALVHSSWSTVSVLLIHKSLNFGNLSLELHHTPAFQQKSDTSRVTSLGDSHTLCRIVICCWNLSVEGSLMLDDPISVPFLCNLKNISLCFIQNSMQITFK